MFFDSHAHYDDERFDPDRHETLEKVYGEGVCGIVNAASDEDSARISLGLSSCFSYVYAAIGVHPMNVASMDDALMDRLLDMASKEKVVAIGEIGLDYKYDDPPRDLQIYWFTRQIEMAAGLGLPIVVHNRDAHDDVLRILGSFKGSVRGVLHHFTGSAEMASELLKCGYHISIAGPVTFKNARKIVDVVRMVPDDRLMIETDCPYLTPEPFRGRRNDSGMLKYTAERIAEIKSVPTEKVAKITTDNAMELFGVKR